MAKKTNTKINGKEYYKVTRTIGHKPDGTPINKQFYGESKRDAENKAIEYMNQLSSGLITDFDKATIDSVMNKWIYSVKRHDNIKPSTFESYEGTYRNYIQNSPIANFKINKTRSIMLQEYYNELNQNGVNSAKIKKMNKLLYQFFKYAISEGYINRNPAENIKIPKLESEKVLKEKIEYYTEDEVKIISEKIRTEDISLIVLFALGTGLRQGELLALRYSDIDFEKSQLKVCRTVKDYYVFDNDMKKHKLTKFSEPKTKNSYRVVDIPKNLLDLLEPSSEDTLIFTDNNKVYEARKLYRHWISFLKKNNLPIKPFHALRHTYATLLLSKGVELITVSKLLGHSSVQITEIYADVIPKLKNDAVSKINNLF